MFFQECFYFVGLVSGAVQVKLASECGKIDVLHDGKYILGNAQQSGIDNLESFGAGSFFC